MVVKDKELICKTKRLVIRLIKKSDYVSWRRSCLGRLEKQNEFDKGPPKEETLTKAFLQRWLDLNKRARKSDLVYTLGIFDKRNGDYLGLVNFAVISRLSYQFANLGYEIHNQFWGQGIAGEAISGAVGLAFKKLHLHRLEAGIEPHNKASIRVCEKLKMKKEGLRKKYYFNGKEWLDLVYFSMNAEDYGVKNSKPRIKPNMSDYLK